MVNVLIVEDEGLFRDMLKISLDSLTDMDVVGAVSDGDSAIESADRLNPDVVLMDIELGSEPNGIAAGKAIKDSHEEMGMIILSAHKEREYLNLIAADEFSGWSYLLKQSVSDAGSLVRAIEGAASGLVVMDPTVVNGMKPRKAHDIFYNCVQHNNIFFLYSFLYSYCHNLIYYMFVFRNKKNIY